MPSSRMRAKTLALRPARRSRQAFVSGPLQGPSMFAMRFQARKAGPGKKSRSSCSVSPRPLGPYASASVASTPVVASGALMPCMAIQSTSSSHWSRP